MEILNLSVTKTYVTNDVTIPLVIYVTLNIFNFYLNFTYYEKLF